MFRIPRRYLHFVYGFIQSGLTCGIASAIAGFPFMASSNFVLHWLQAWLFSWLLMLPVVLLAAPAIRRLAQAVTTEE
jgi:hypothetical protein